MDLSGRCPLQALAQRVPDNISRCCGKGRAGVGGQRRGALGGVRGMHHQACRLL